MKQYKLINNISGWVVWLIATIVYVMTIEPTASFWDCGEFITSAYKLEVGHPPGAPFFMLIGRLFSMFAGDPSQVAMTINLMSALSSSFTILFLFWSVSYIARRIMLKKDEVPNMSQTIAIMGSGAVGALAYTFSDTFWFSAVEGEVYAMSSLFTAMVFWAVLKWESVSDKPHADRWIVLIAYMMGISIGIHLLNLLVIPAIVFVYYFKKHPMTKRAILIASLISAGILGGVVFVIIPGVVQVAGKFELLFVNSFGLPYLSGFFFYVILIIGAIVFLLWFSLKHKRVWLNTAILCLTMILIGYSSFALILIRSKADPPMDQNNPDNFFSLLSYLNREQYGDRPLAYGQYFNAPPTSYEEGAPVYYQLNGRYEIVDHKTEVEFDDEYETVFPRMYSSNQNHPEGYVSWTGIDKKPSEVTEPISFGKNLRFFFRYQIGFMYMRYFLWNFAGRQNDIQGHGGVMNGNWVSGIPMIDNARLGDQSTMPDHLKNNAANNQYYFLPLILGILGLIFLATKNREYFWVTLLFFILTGLAIIIYLNQPPFQPRERDYAYAGSFYAFAIFIGLGVLALYEWLKDRLKISPMVIAGGTTVICLLAVPTLMAAENWDDHDRSERYTARDFAYNYLNSCAPNAILFTNGDNDTFPLWYAQEVEGIRTDVRVINLSYLNTDWYANQMRRRAYKSDPVPFALSPEKYRQGNLDGIPIFARTDKYFDLKQIMEFVESEDPSTKVTTRSNSKPTDFIPTGKFSLSVDKQKVLEYGVVLEKDADKIVDELRWERKRGYLQKNELLVLALLAANDWKRPVYFAITVGPSSFMGLEDYFQLEGFAYRLVPIKTDAKRSTGYGYVNSEIMYSKLMNEFRWGGLENPDVYLDENNTRMTLNIRSVFARLADQLLAEGKRDSAIAVLDRCTELLPPERVTYTYYNLLMADAYYRADANEKANQIILELLKIHGQELVYFNDLDEDKRGGRLQEDMERSAMLLNEILRIAVVRNQEDNIDFLVKHIAPAAQRFGIQEISAYIMQLQQNGGIPAIPDTVDMPPADTTNLPTDTTR